MRRLVLGALLAAGCATTSPSAPAAQPEPGPMAADAPAAAGQARVSLEGCLAQASEEAASRFPVRSGTRSAAEPMTPPITTTLTGLGVTVAHALDHACCLAAKVQTTVEQGVITVAERLEGTPCRCHCSSVIRTEVGLSPGTYTVVVTYEGQEVHREQVSVKSLLSQ